MAGGGDFFAGGAFGAALLRLFDVDAPAAFFLESALVSARFLLRLEAERAVSVSAVLAFDFALLAGVFVSVGSVAGRREPRRDVAAGASAASVRPATVLDLAFASSPGVATVPERVRAEVPVPLALGAASAGSPAFGAVGEVPRWRGRNSVAAASVAAGSAFGLGSDPDP